MSKDDDPVSEKLCIARMQTLVERIEGLKKAIYISGAAMTTVIVTVQFILTLLRG